MKKQEIWGWGALQQVPIKVTDVTREGRLIKHGHSLSHYQSQIRREHGRQHQLFQRGVPGRTENSSVPQGKEPGADGNTTAKGRNKANVHRIDRCGHPCLEYPILEEKALHSDLATTQVNFKDLHEVKWTSTKDSYCLSPLYRSQVHRHREW